MVEVDLAVSHPGQAAFLPALTECPRRQHSPRPLAVVPPYNIVVDLQMFLSADSAVGKNPPLMKLVACDIWVQGLLAERRAEATKGKSGC